MKNLHPGHRLELERELRLTVLAAWQEFARAKQISMNSLQRDDTSIREGETFWCYQRAMKRFSDFVLYNKIPDEV